MSRAPGAGSYRAVLRLPFALRTFVPALAGRLAYGVFPLATLFTVQQATGSYATAGVAVAAFGLASLTLPAKARLADRFGQRAALPPLALLCAAALHRGRLRHRSRRPGRPDRAGRPGRTAAGLGDAVELAAAHRRDRPEGAGVCGRLGRRGVALPARAAAGRAPRRGPSGRRGAAADRGPVAPRHRRDGQRATRPPSGADPPPAACSTPGRCARPGCAGCSA